MTDRAELKRLALAATDYPSGRMVVASATILDLLATLERQRAALEQKESQMRSLLLLPHKYDLNDYARLRIAVEEHVEVGCITGHTGQGLVDALAASTPEAT